MLNFFRKYEKYFFIVITAVIVISFSFFGTYGTLEKNAYVDKPAFTAIDGRQVKTSELDEFLVFLGSDNEDKMFLGGAWGPNFLNDGVIKKDFLETGLAQTLAHPYLEQMRDELEARLQKEKRFVPYQHPQAKFISAANAWKMIAPQIAIQLETLKTSEDPASDDAFDARVKLFLAQRQFPAHYLRYILYQQEKQNSWIQPDPRLERSDLTLFGYRTLSDWFGQGFQRLVAQFIINSAIIAEKQGYSVSKAEVLADLYRHAEESFQQNSNHPNLGVVNVQQYVDEQLRRMHMDQSTAVAIWEKVLLFRRLFQDVGGSAFVDPYTLNQFEKEAHQSADGDLYHLPSNLHLNDLAALQKFELYLAAVSSRTPSAETSLALPETFKTPEEVAKKYPQLVQKRYLVNVGKVNRETLQTKVGLKTAWDWELQEANWSEIKKSFPELGTKTATTNEERQAILDGLERRTRQKVDQFARKKIVEAHPEWLEEALAASTKEKQIVGIQQKGENSFFPEVTDPRTLIDLLDKYPQTQKALESFSADGQIFYRIEVLEKSPSWEVLTFAEANQSGILDSLLDVYLQAGGDKQADRVVEAVRKQYGALKKENSQEMIADYAASRRLVGHLNGLRERFQNHPETITASILDEKMPNESIADLSKRKELKDQWKLIKSPHIVRRGDTNEIVEASEIFALKPGEWSQVYARADGENAFFHIKALATANTTDLYQKAQKIQDVLSSEAQKALAQRLLEDMKGKEALSLKPKEQV